MGSVHQEVYLLQDLGEDWVRKRLLRLENIRFKLS
jgi:hypothetical protein